MRISDWSSDVCSSDLVRHLGDLQRVKAEKAGDGRQKKQQDRRRRAMNRPSRKIHVHDASTLTRSPSPMKLPPDLTIWVVGVSSPLTAISSPLRTPVVTFS